MISKDKHWEKKMTRIKSAFSYADAERNDLLLELKKYISKDRIWEKRMARIRSTFVYADAERKNLLLEVEKYRYQLKKILEIAKIREAFENADEEVSKIDVKDRWKYIIRIIEGDDE